MVFLYTLLFIFAIVGFTEIISYLIFRIMSVKNECSTMLITPINSNSNYEFIIRSVTEKAKWMGSFRPQKIILAPFRKILAVLPVIGPIVNSAVVPHDHRSGINEFQIFRRRNARIGPTVIRLRNARAIMPHGIRLKPDSIGRQPYIDAPGRPRQQIEHPDDTACAAVRVFAGQIIHRI